MLAVVGRAAAITVTGDGDSNDGNGDSGGSADGDKVFVICNHFLFIKCNI